MTIEHITIVYGVRINRKTFYEWIMRHISHPWYKAVCKSIESEDGYTFKSYLEMLSELGQIEAHDSLEYDEAARVELDEKRAIYCDIHQELISDLKSLKEDGDKLNIYEITHDHYIEDVDYEDPEETNDLVIGVPLTVLSISAPSKVSPEDKILTTYPDLDVWRRNRVDNDPIIKDLSLVCRFYNIQDDCSCCS
jgi:hypothetical protein